MNTAFNFLILLFILSSINVNGQNNAYLVRDNGQKFKCYLIEDEGDSLKFVYYKEMSGGVMSKIQSSVSKSSVLYYSMNGKITHVANSNKIAGKLISESGVKANNALALYFVGGIAGGLVAISINPIAGSIVLGVFGVISVTQIIGANNKLKQAGEILMQAP